MSLNKIVFSLVLSTLIVVGFNLFLLRNNIDTFVNRQVIQSTTQRLQLVESALVEYLDQQSDRIDNLSQPAILHALSKREFATTDIALIERSIQTILENNIALQYVRIVDVDRYQLLYSTNATDVVEISTEAVQYQTLTSLANLAEEAVFAAIATTPRTADSSAPVYITQIDQPNNRLIVAIPLASTTEGEDFLAMAYYAIDRLPTVLPHIADSVRSLIGVDNGIVVNPIPSIDYQSSVAEPIVDHTVVQLSDGTQYVALTEQSPSSLLLYEFISQQQLIVSPITNLLVLGAIGSMLFVITLFIINLSQRNEVYIKNQLSIFRKKLLNLVNNSPDFRDFELLNRLTLQKETLYKKIIASLKGSDETNRKLFDTGWQRLLAALQLDGVLNESSVHKEFQERFPSGSLQPSSAPSQQSASATPSRVADATQISQSTVPHTSTADAAAMKIDSVEDVENIEQLGEAEQFGEPATPHGVAATPLSALDTIVSRNTSGATPAPHDGVVRTKGLLYKVRLKRLQRKQLGSEAEHTGELVTPHSAVAQRLAGAHDAPSAPLATHGYIAPQSTSFVTPAPNGGVVRTKGLLYKVLVKNMQPITEHNGIMQISQLLISHQQKQPTQVHDKELGELIDTLSV